MAEIDFDIGAKVILQGPAAFQLLLGQQRPAGYGQGHGRNQDRAARGFKISRREATFVDQGTEFGVEVSPGRRQPRPRVQGLRGRGR